MMMINVNFTSESAKVDRTKQSIHYSIIGEAQQNESPMKFKGEYKRVLDEIIRETIRRNERIKQDEGKWTDEDIHEIKVLKIRILKMMLTLVAYNQDAILRAEMLGLQKCGMSTISEGSDVTGAMRRFNDSITGRDASSELVRYVDDFYSHTHWNTRVYGSPDKNDLVRAYNTHVTNTKRYAGEDAYILQGLEIFEELPS